MKDDLVIDVGAHIGAFSKLAIDRGASKVFAFEVDTENYMIAKSNLTKFISRGQITLNQTAVWGSVEPKEKLYFGGYENWEENVNTGGGRLSTKPTTQKVKLVSLDNIIDTSLMNERKRIKFLKIDCEGSEWPILFTSQKLNQIDMISGELHELPESSEEFQQFKVPGVSEYTAVELGKHLMSQGFDFAFHYIDKNEFCDFSRLAIFNAIRR